MDAIQFLEFQGKQIIIDLLPDNVLGTVPTFSL